MNEVKQAIGVLLFQRSIIRPIGGFNVPEISTLLDLPDVLTFAALCEMGREGTVEMQRGQFYINPMLN